MLWRTFWGTNHSIWFVGWVSSYLCERPVKNPSIWKESFTRNVPYAERLWKGDILVGDIEELETMDASEIYSKRLDSKEVTFPRENGKIIFQSQMDESHFLEDQELRTHLDTGTPNSRRRSQRFSWRIRRVPFTTSRLTSGCRWSDKWFLVHVRKLHIPPSRWTQSQTLLAERRIIPYSTEVHWRYQNYAYEFGCQARKTHRWPLEYRWINRFVWFLDRFHSIYSIKWETSRRINVVRRETDNTASDIQTRTVTARALHKIEKKC